MRVKPMPLHSNCSRSPQTTELYRLKLSGDHQYVLDGWTKRQSGLRVASWCRDQCIVGHRSRTESLVELIAVYFQRTNDNCPIVYDCKGQWTVAEHGQNQALTFFFSGAFWKCMSMAWAPSKSSKNLSMPGKHTNKSHMVGALQTKRGIINYNNHIH